MYKLEEEFHTLSYHWISGLFDTPLSLPVEEPDLPDILAWFWYSRSNPDIIKPDGTGEPTFIIDPHPFEAEPPWHFNKNYPQVTFEERAASTAWEIWGAEFEAPGPSSMVKVVFGEEHFEGGKYWYDFTTELYQLFGRGASIKGIASAGALTVLLLFRSMMEGYPCRKRQTL